MSNDKQREKRCRRKSKVSWGRLIRPGLVDPKPRPFGVGDGQAVNIRLPVKSRYYFLSDAGRTVVRTVGCVRLMHREVQGEV